MKTLLQFLKTTIIGGLLFLVPVVLLVLVIEKALAIAEKVITPAAQFFPNAPVYGVAVTTIAAVSMLLLLSFFAGLIARTAAGKRFVTWLEDVFLSKMPGYTVYRSMIGDMTKSIVSLENDSSAKAVLVRFDDGWQIGFQVDELDSGEIAVFIPGAPSPLSGSLYYMEKERIRDSGLSVIEAAAMLRRIGVGSSSQLRVG